MAPHMSLSLSLLVLLAAISCCVARGSSTLQPKDGVGSKGGVTAKGGKKCPPSLSRGWADEVNWVQTYEEGLHKARKSNRPLMVIHHLEDCPYSQALKKSFAENAEIQKMARDDFVMLNLQFETEDKNLWPDGQYVPRIVFVDPSWTVRADVVGQYQNRMYTYEPSDIDILIKNMKTAKILVKTDF